MTDQSNIQAQFTEKKAHATILDFKYNPDNSCERYFKHKGEWIDFFDVNQRVRRALSEAGELMQHGDKLTITIEVHRQE